MNEHCCKTVYHVGGSFRGSSCAKKPKVQIDGKWYCATHDPVRVKERDTERQKRWDAESKQRQEKWDRESAVLNFCEGVDTETIKTFVSNGETMKKWIGER